RSAALNMAIDEAILESATQPAIRFYRWERPALSFGYFGQFADVEGRASARDAVRRWTGGGIVFHGEDLTYSIVIPRTDAALGESSMSIYRKSHEAICRALAGCGQAADLAQGRDAALRRPKPTHRAVATNVCLHNPVRLDML